MLPREVLQNPAWQYALTNTLDGTDPSARLLCGPETGLVSWGQGDPKWGTVFGEQVRVAEAGAHYRLASEVLSIRGGLMAQDPNRPDYLRARFSASGFPIVPTPMSVYPGEMIPGGMLRDLDRAAAEGDPWARVAVEGQKQNEAEAPRIGPNGQALLNDL